MRGSGDTMDVAKATPYSCARAQYTAVYRRFTGVFVRRTAEAMALYFWGIGLAFKGFYQTLRCQPFILAPFQTYDGESVGQRRGAENRLFIC